MHGDAKHPGSLVIVAKEAWCTKYPTMPSAGFYSAGTQLAIIVHEPCMVNDLLCVLSQTGDVFYTFKEYILEC